MKATTSRHPLNKDSVKDITSSLSNFFFRGGGGGEEGNIEHENFNDKYRVILRDVL